MPNNWAITSFEEIVELISGRDLETSSCNDIKEGIPYLIGASNIVKRSLFITRWTTKPIVISQKNDILISCKGTIGEVIRNTIGDIHIARQFMALRNNSIVDTNYIELYIRAILERIKSDARGVIPGISREDILCREILLPPLNEQKRIVLEASKLISIIEKINVDKNELVKAIAAYKLTILQLAITGKLVPQDLSDEPAIDLLRRVNPNYKPCDNRHYMNVPKGWAVCTFEDILEYEQPQQYIVNSIDYSDEYEIPVLTAGKSFIIGKTNEKSGICKRLPVIIFDDFTTDSKYVDFPFKVKSSAIKILHAKGNVNPQYIAYLMSVTRLIGDTHKRYWISEYSKIPIMLPPVNEQEKIVSEIEKIYERLNKILAEL